MNESNSAIRIAIFGAGSLIETWIKHTSQDAYLQLCLVVQTGNYPSARTQKIAQKNAIHVVHEQDINEVDFVSYIESLDLDFIISADNFRIFGDRLLDAPKVSCINFHNGPLEKYRGLNIPTWVIWNNEPDHTVVWHTMLKEIDAGSVVVTNSFQLDPDETAFSLTIKMIENASQLIPELCRIIKNWEAEKVGFSNPDISAGSRYYRKSDLPNQGVIDLEWSTTSIDRFVRSYTYDPLPILQDYPKIVIDNEAYSVKRIAEVKSSVKISVLDRAKFDSENNVVKTQCSDCAITFDVRAPIEL